MMMSVAMVDPQYFDVEYAINPYMKDSSGRLNKIDKTIARHQWENLKKTYETLGFDVFVLEAGQNLPDMVFAANQSFPYLDLVTKKPSVIMSRMRSPFRQPEVEYFLRFYTERGYQIQTLTSECSFEGNGDALIRPGTNEIWGGYGFRTDLSIYTELKEKTGYKIHTLKLVSEYFYHLDTCFSLLDSETVAIVPQAFDPDSQKFIQDSFQNVIIIDQDEARRFFAGNCHCPDGKNVLLHPGSPRLVKELKNKGFNPLEVGTSEFMKSGGSVFCMKMMLPAFGTSSASS